MNTLTYHNMNLFSETVTHFQHSDCDDHHQKQQIKAHQESEPFLPAAIFTAHCLRVIDVSLPNHVTMSYISNQTKNTISQMQFTTALLMADAPDQSMITTLT